MTDINQGCFLSERGHRLYGAYVNMYLARCHDVTAPRPDIGFFLELAGADEQPLRVSLDAFLVWAPIPEPSDEERVLARQAVERAIEQADLEASLLDD